MLLRATRTLALLAVIAAVSAGCTATTTDAETPRATDTPTQTPTPECIVGTWSVGAEQLQPIYDALPGGLEYPDAVIDPAASATISFATDGTFAFTQSVPTSVTWLGHTASVALGGTMTGDYETDGDALALTAQENDLIVVPTDDGRASAIFASETAETLAEWPVSASSYTCADDDLVLHLGTEGYNASVPFVRQ
ncbi:hypothetical protein [Microbacterium sp. SSM24]|uniref:hypothetical protein n=1 Tax=Microbacterium sp. SSM24 TaxID=2991714 RepID=UPI002225DC1F|nr:hypothetical protein [Microbacterium sp. SSM24]MCW3493299.1 hypothetical protein [Microbacterium sp. SSM24]